MPPKSSTLVEQQERPTKAPLTSEQLERIEKNRLRAKAIFEARQRGEAVPDALIPAVSSSAPTEAGNKKRPHGVVEPSSRKGGEGRDHIQPAKKFAKFVEYDLSKMTDTKGGFMSIEDDPHSILSAQNLKDKPEKMSLEEWARHQARVQAIRDKKGAYEPAISALNEPEEDKICFECKSPEIDWKWKEVYKCRVCEKCKKDFPDKYSLLTKTDAREDYLLTDPELRDEEILPHMEQPNPHKSTWSNMMLYLRYQVEGHAIKKWGSLEALDAEFEKRTAEKKSRNSKKFATKLRELKKRTRVDAWKRERSIKGGYREKHEHVWGTAVEKAETGESVRTCEECGFEIEELVF
ncbi:XPA protein C-terminus-domain-containing protein [Geopyxis carbonaria]|nr:XPA protein C-terminus-domain-containing protein [Geopyxis carbonaria]